MGTSLPHERSFVVSRCLESNRLDSTMHRINEILFDYTKHHIQYEYNCFVFVVQSNEVLDSLSTNFGCPLYMLVSNHVLRMTQKYDE